MVTGTILEHPDYKLGVTGPSPWDSKRVTLNAALYAARVSVKPPSQIAAGRLASLAAAPWGIMLNDEEGDCTIAGRWHTIQAQTTYEKRPFVQPDPAIHSEYRALTGGGDDGLDLLTVLKAWKAGTYGGHALAAYAEIPWTDPKLSAAYTRQLLKIGVWAAGASYIAVMLPAAQQRNPMDWITVGTGPDWRPGTWGGHCVPILAYRLVGGKLRFLIVTWGQLVEVSEEYLRAFCVETWMPVSQVDWTNTKGKTPSGRTIQATVDLALSLAA